MLRFLNAIKTWREEKEREAFLNKHGFDTKCPHCQKWQGNCGGVIGKADNYPNDHSDSFRCGNCKRWFVMDYRGMIAEPSDDQEPALYLDQLEQNNDQKTPAVAK